MINQEQSNEIKNIWQGICWWMNNKGIPPAELSRLTGFPQARIEMGIRGELERPSSDFVHACVDVFGLRNARNRSFEDTADILTDEECISLLTAPLREKPRQGNFWD